MEVAGSDARIEESARNKKLEAKIASEPESDEARAIYADWLQAQGDLRGELAALHLAAQTATGASRGLRTKANRLIEEHPGRFLPIIVRDVLRRHEHRKSAFVDRKPYWQSGKLELTWRGGFISAIELRKAYGEGVALSQVLAALLSHPSSRLIETLELGTQTGEDDYTDYGQLTSVVGQAELPTLRRLVACEFGYQDCELSWSDLGDLRKVWKAAPNLEELVVNGGQFELGTIRLPKLRRFALRTTGLTKKNFRRVSGGAFPRLEKLEIWLGCEERGGNVSPRMVATLLEGKAIPKVVDLGLMNTEITDEICLLLAASKIAGRLLRLDLSMGTMTDDGARTLAVYANAFSKLEVLNVESNYLTPAARHELRSVAKRITFGEQRGDGIDGARNRYCAVSE